MSPAPGPPPRLDCGRATRPCCRAMEAAAGRGPPTQASEHYLEPRGFMATTATAGPAQHAPAPGWGFSFVQISDSHIGFNKAANQDVTGTLKLAIDKINALPAAPDLLLHTGDITQSSKASEFDTAQQIVKGAK